MIFAHTISQYKINIDIFMKFSVKYFIYMSLKTFIVVGVFMQVKSTYNGGKAAAKCYTPKLT